MSERVIVSTILDTKILSLFPNDNILIFDSIDLLFSYINNKPVSTDKLLITSDTLETNSTQSFNTLLKILDNPFFRLHETLDFIVAENSSVINRINFLKDGNCFPSNIDVNIVNSPLTKNSLLSILRGEYSTGPKQESRKAVVRMRTKEYKEYRKKQQQTINTVLSPNEEIETESDQLSVIDNIKPEPNILYRYEEQASVIQILGETPIQRTSFAVVLAQFLQGYGKVLLVDTDMEYFSLSYLLSSITKDYLNIPIREFYRDPLNLANQIRNSDKKLICLTGTSADKEEGFPIFEIIRTLYNILCNDLKYVIYETSISNYLASLRSIVVIENNILSVLKTIPSIAVNDTSYVQFASIDTYIQNIRIVDSKLLSGFVSNLLDIDVVVPIYDIKSLELGGDNIHDLHRYV